jgi:DNA-binding NarL/FixJ family response regulator
MQPNTARIAIIDDDPFVVSHLTESIRNRLPDVEVVGILDPLAPVGYQVYVIDRDFGGNSCGQDLMQRVKRIAPDSLVIAYSAFLDRDYLRSLILEHCEGAFDKGSLAELEKMIELIEEFLENSRSPGKSSLSSRNTVRSIFELVREWNTRLSQNGHASPRYHSDV